MEGLTPLSIEILHRFTTRLGLHEVVLIPLPSRPQVIEAALRLFTHVHLVIEDVSIARFLRAVIYRGWTPFRDSHKLTSPADVTRFEDEIATTPREGQRRGFIRFVADNDAAMSTTYKSVYETHWCIFNAWRSVLRAGKDQLTIHTTIPTIPMASFLLYIPEGYTWGDDEAIRAARPHAFYYSRARYDGKALKSLWAADTASVDAHHSLYTLDSLHEAILRSQPAHPGPHNSLPSSPPSYRQSLLPGAKRVASDVLVREKEQQKKARAKMKLKHTESSTMIQSKLLPDPDPVPALPLCQWSDGTFALF